LVRLAIVNDYDAIAAGGAAMPSEIGTAST
jgi:hypothetical protein